MPLIGDLGKKRGQIVKALQHSLTGTIGTALPVGGSAGNDRLIAVPQIAFPPDLAVALPGHGIRGEVAVLFEIPLPCEYGIAACKIILAGNDGFPAQTGQPLPCVRLAIDACHS